MTNERNSSCPREPRVPEIGTASANRRKTVRARRSAHVALTVLSRAQCLHKETQHISGARVCVEIIHIAVNR